MSTAPKWVRSTRCEAVNCVEVAVTDDGAAVRNSTNPGEVLTFDHGEWAAFVAGAKAGEFDL